MKAFFAAVMGKSCYKKWTVNKPGAFNFLYYVQLREISGKKMAAGVAHRVDFIYQYTITHRVKKLIRFGQFTAAAKWRAINRFYPVSQTE